MLANGSLLQVAEEVGEGVADVGADGGFGPVGVVGFEGTEDAFVLAEGGLEAVGELAGDGLEPADLASEDAH